MTGRMHALKRVAGLGMGWQDTNAREGVWEGSGCGGARNGRWGSGKKTDGGRCHEGGRLYSAEAGGGEPSTRATGSRKGRRGTRTSRKGGQGYFGAGSANDSATGSGGVRQSASEGGAHTASTPHATIPSRGAGQEGAAQSARPPLGVNSSICLADVSISILLPKPGHSPAPPYPSPTPRSCARCCGCSSSARAHARQAGAVRDRICIPRRERHVRSIDAARAGGRAGACASMFGRAQGRSFFIPVPAQGGRGGGASVSIIAVRTCHGDGGTTACHQERENTRRGGRPCAVGRRLAGMSPPCAVRWEHRAPTDDRRRYHVKVRDEISSRAPDRDAGGTRHDRARCFAASPAARELEATCPL